MDLETGVKLAAAPGVLPLLDYAAVAVFAASGALAAAREKHDVITFAFFAAVTGVGGGTIRDLLLGVPVFWIGQPYYLLSCLGAALAVWVWGAGAERLRLLVWLDALGLSAYAVVGASKALALGAPPLSAVVMGVLTASFGGVLRDVLAHEPSILLRREIYVSAAVAGASIDVALRTLGQSALVSGAAGILVALLLRGAAILYGWSLPGFPGNGPGDARR